MTSRHFSAPLGVDTCLKGDSGWNDKSPMEGTYDLEPLEPTYYFALHDILRPVLITLYVTSAMAGTLNKH